jgi:hypothetical protein
MRPEVVEALHYAERLRQQPNTYWETHKPEIGKDYSFLSTDEHNANFDRLVVAYDYIRTCLLQKIPDLDIYPGTTTNLCLRWDDNTHNEIILELSLYGPLVAPFVYGQAPSNVQEVLEECITACGLIPLTEEEIAELEENRTFLSIFP